MGGDGGRALTSRRWSTTKSSPHSTISPSWQFETDGRTASYLTIDYSIACQSEHGKTARRLAALTVAVFPVGVPLVLFLLLYRHREQIFDRTARSGDKELNYIGA